MSKPEAWPMWLGEAPADVPRLKSSFAPYPSDEMILLAGESAGWQRQE